MKPPAPLKPIKPLNIAIPKAGATSTQKRKSLPFMINTLTESPVAGVTAPSDDIETQTTQLLDETQKAYRAEEKRQAEAVAAKNDEDAPISFFRVIVFNSPEQARAFATAVGEHENQQYMDGRKICDRLNIAIPDDNWKPMASLMKPNKRLQAIAMPIPSKTS